MKIEQIYTGCLAHAAYYIESKGCVAIVDPLREVYPYINRAKLNDAKIKYIFETHFHADFVSGHIDLAKKTGAKIVFGPTAKPNYKAIIADDNQVFELGDCKIKVIHTPGHTMESTTFMLIDENNKEHGIVTGDTLFIGDVGRPDLAQEGTNVSQEKLAELLFDSLRTKIMPLSDQLIVYPNHGAGSVCGKNISKETTDTLGNQKKTNYALRADMTKEEFVKEVLSGLTKPPAYFPYNVQKNRKGYESLDKVMVKSKLPLNPTNFELVANSSNAIILDVRHQEEFQKGHIPRSIFIGIDGDFAPWVGKMITDNKQPILLVVPKGREEEVITRLSRVGFDNVIGYLDKGFEAWKKESKEYDAITSISAKLLKQILQENELPIFDVRKTREYKKGHVINAKHACLSKINEHLLKFIINGSFVIYCEGGYRSMIAASILKSRGIHNLINIEGGYASIKKEGIKIKTINKFKY